MHEIGHPHGLESTVCACICACACSLYDHPYCRQLLLITEHTAARVATVAWIAEQWADALHQWLGITDDCVHIVTKGKDCQLEGKDFQFLITSYNFVTKLKEQLQILAPKVMVLDEAHSIKASKVAIHKFGVFC